MPNGGGACPRRDALPGGKSCGRRGFRQGAEAIGAPDVDGPRRSPQRLRISGWDAAPVPLRPKDDDQGPQAPRNRRAHSSNDSKQKSCRV